MQTAIRKSWLELSAGIFFVCYVHLCNSDQLRTFLFLWFLQIVFWIGTWFIEGRRSAP